MIGLRKPSCRGSNDRDVGQLYTEHAARVHRWTRRFFAAGDAEEVVHEIFLKVIERIDTFRNDASPTTWLYRMTLNHCLNRLRNETRRGELWDEHGDAATWATPVPQPDQDTCTFLRQFWRQLDDELVEVGYHYFVDGMTHAEIARVMNCSARTVGHRLERLRALAQQAAESDAGSHQRPLGQRVRGETADRGEVVS